MQFTSLTLFTLVAAALASPLSHVQPRQAEVLVETPAMTDKDGNIIPFDAETVTQPNLEAGL